MPSSNPKEAKLDSDANKSVSSLDVSATQSALEAVDQCQNELEGLNERASREILAIEQNYNKLRRPHYEKRNKVIDGIPDFWYNAFINHPHIAALLSSDEQECLRSLSSINVEEFEDIKSGYRIAFTFKENSYFTNKELVKEFFLDTVDGEPVSKPTPVEWKEGKDLTKPAAQAKGRKRQLGPHSGFFSWFVSTGDPNLDEIAETIKDDMWVNPLQYYLASEIEVSAENGHSDDDSDEDEDLDESVVVIGDDDSEDDDDGAEPEIFEVGDDDDDDEDDDDDDVQEVDGDDDEQDAGD